MRIKRISGLIVLGLSLSILPVQAQEDVAMYRMYNSLSGEHLITKDKNERNVLYRQGWTYEGIAWLAPEASSLPVYRLYNPGSGEHLYTVDLNEYQVLPGYGWKQEGVSFYSDDQQAIPVYRLYYPGNGMHHYTSDANEYAQLPRYGWRQEGIAYYGKRLASGKDQDDLAKGSLYGRDNLMIVANKKHRLPNGYVPRDLRTVKVRNNGNQVLMRNEAAGALEEMFAAAQRQGITLVSASAYRSEAYQARLYNMYARQSGTAVADRDTSRPGYSDHQTGLAVDISDHDGRTFLTERMAQTAEGQWLYKHAHEYGFILRYPRGKQAITGYVFEPWHYRYVGKENAAAIYGISPDETLEEYLSVSGGDYQ